MDIEKPPKTVTLPEELFCLTKGEEIFVLKEREENGKIVTRLLEKLEI